MLSRDLNRGMCGGAVILTRVTMEILCLGLSIWCAVVLLFCIWRVVNWGWCMPRKLENFLRQQGPRGSSCYFICGETKEISGVNKEAISMPINFDDDLKPRVMPFDYGSFKKYGMYSYLIFIK